MSSGHLGLFSGVGLVVANMVGAGVFLSGGFMSQSMTPGEIMLSWVVGAVIALCGAYAYAGIATQNEASGGEYRYLHDHLHPFLGYVSGWASLLIGFSATIAIDAYAAGAFLQRVWGGVNPKVVGFALLVGLTVAHAFQLNTSRWMQNTLVFLKFGLVSAFVGIGLVLGSHVWPTWSPPSPPTSELTNFASNQYWIAFAFSGWNASIYIANEFKNPKRDVPRAMLIGCGSVGILYLIINAIVVANLTPDTAIGVAAYDSEKVTLAHLVMQSILGDGAANLVSIAAFFVFASATSAMVMLGPRVYAAMADDGLLPAIFKTQEGSPPKAGLTLQFVVAFALLVGSSILEIVSSASIVLMISSALTASILVFGRIESSHLQRAAAVTYAGACAMILAFGTWSVTSFGVVGAILFFAAVGYGLGKRN
ncbi:MAG: amino acid permease [bacterium]